MKSINHFRVIFAIAMMLSVALSTLAHDFEVDGIYYNYLDETAKTVEVTYKGSKYSDYSNEYVGTVTIPYTVTYSGTIYFVTTIGNEAFRGCTGLTEVTISLSVTSIGNRAFYNCTGLTEVTIPSGLVTTIGAEAFGGCTGLTEVTIPLSVTSIGNSAFKGCTGLNEVNYNAENCTSMGSLGDPVFSGCSNLKTINIGNSVKIIPSYAFYGCTSLTSVTIPNSVTSIGNYAFQSCSGLTGVLTIPNSVTSIGVSAFAYCSGLNSVNYNAVNCTSMGASNSPVFYGCSNLKTLNIGNEVKTIPSNAFYGCTGLTGALTIPNSVTSIGVSAFYGCTGLTGALTIPNSVTSIGVSAFYGCTGLTGELIIEDGTSTLILNKDLFGNCFFKKLYLGRSLSLNTNLSPLSGQEMESVTIGNSMTEIGEGVLDGCSTKSLTVGVGLLSIGKQSFSSKKTIFLGNTVPSGWTNLMGSVNYVSTDVYGNGNNIYVYPYLNSMFDVGGVKYVPINISERTCVAIDCYYDQSLTSINIGEYVTYKGIQLAVKDINPYACYDNDNIIECNISIEGDIGTYAFGDCSNVTSTKITAEKIGKSAFYGCSAITTANITADEIGVGAFYNSMSKTDAIAVIKSPVIYDFAFQNTGLLKQVTIESEILKRSSFKKSGITTLDINNQVKSIGNSCFMDCANLTSVNIGSGITVLPDSVFYNCNVLEGITIPQNITAINNNAFYGCTKLATITFEDGKDELLIGYGGNRNPMFYNCNLNYVYIGRNLNYDNSSNVKYSPFYGNSSIETVEIVANETDISQYMFKGCTNLMNVNISDCVINMKNNAFEGCSSLEEIRIPNSVTSSIGSYCFSNCTNLSKIEIGTSIPLIENFAFYNCKSLPSINIPGDVTEIKDNAFDGCSCLANVSFNEQNNIEKSQILKLGSSGSNPLFVNCPLDSVFIGKNLSYPESENKGYSPFYRNSTLRSVYITNVEDSIPNNEFYGCTSLEKIVMGDGIKSIGSWAFSECLSLNYLSYGSSLETIGEEAFSDCQNVTKIYSNAINPPACGTQALEDINKWNCELFVPLGSLSAYQNANQWKNFFFMSELGENYISGDANGDGDVTVSDIVMVANNIMGVASDSFVLEAADIDNDGSISVTDIVMLSNIIMNSSATASIEPFAMNGASLSINNIENCEGGIKKIEIALDNEMDLTAFQMDVVLPKGMKIADCSLSKRAIPSHTLLSKEQSNGAYRLMSYSLGSHTYRGHEGTLLTLEVTTDGEFYGGDIMINNIRVAESNGTEHKLSAVKQPLNSISSVDAVNAESLQITTKNHAIVIESSVDAIAYVYSVDGMVREMPIYVGSNEMRVDVDGLYIVKVGSLVEKVMIK